MNRLQAIQRAFEIHSVEGILEGFAAGIDPNMEWNGKPLVYDLVNMYTRGPRFKDCVRAFLDNGWVGEDPLLWAVLSDQSFWLDSELKKDPSSLYRTYTLNCTFTPLIGASLLHICAEYGHLDCAQVLLRHGADVNAKAGTDTHGFGGHTPIFHTVNQDDNKGMEMLQFLLAHQADLDISVKGLIWGEGYDWETYIPEVNPISYAMMGLLRQFQRTEKDIYEIVQVLQQKKYGHHYVPKNIPNRYLLK